MLIINRTVDSKSAVAAPEGRLDTITAPELEGSLKEILPG